MTRKELRRLFPGRWDWLPWRDVTVMQFVIMTALGVCLGIAAQRTTDMLRGLPAVHRNAAQAATFDGYLGVIIDRTRSSWCDVHPSRIMFQQTVGANGAPITVVLPLTSIDPAWPNLGRQTFMLLLAKINDIPPGRWKIVETQREDCDWLDFLTGGRVVVTNPVEVAIP